MQPASQQLQQTHTIRVVRRNIARINTVITEKMGEKSCLVKQNQQGRLVLGSVSVQVVTKQLRWWLSVKVMHPKYRKYIKEPASCMPMMKTISVNRGSGSDTGLSSLSKTKTWTLIEIVESAPGTV